MHYVNSQLSVQALVMIPSQQFFSCIKSMVDPYFATHKFKGWVHIKHHKIRTIFFLFLNLWKFSGSTKHLVNLRQESS